MLAAGHRRVVIVTPGLEVGRSVPYVNLLGIHQRLRATHVEVIRATVPVRFADGVLELADAFTGEYSKLDDVAVFTWSTPRVVDDALLEPLRARDIPVRLVGDCFSPRTVLAAIHGAHRIGQEV